MLATIAEFPNAGSIAFLAHSAQKVRVLQHKPHEQGGPAVLVSVFEDPRGHQPATTRTVPRADIYPDGEAAMLAGKPTRRGRRQRGRG